jgi:molybdopterin-containing oxidoreductase family membrane subunit
MNKEEGIYIQNAFRPLLSTGRGFYVFAAGLIILLMGWVYFVYVQTTLGHGVQGLGTKGAMWGILVANIVHLIGISHVGIAISASVRIMNLERYKPLARIAELVTLVSMTAAVINIGLDVGRPDRFIFNVVLHGRVHAPFVWSMTVISWYIVGSSVYLYLAMRRDLCISSIELPKWRWLFRILSIGYADNEKVRDTHNRTIWWCAVIILPIMVSVHSVYGFVFGLQPGRPGWFNPIMAPYFVLGAIVSGFSAMIIIVAILRKIYPWQEFLPPRMFKGLGVFLGFVTWLYMYFLFSEILTGIYAAPEADHNVWADYLWGRFAPLTWPTLLVGLAVPFWLLFIQGCNPKICSIGLTVTAAIMINLALWMIRYLIVVPSFYHPLLPYRVAPYFPTIIEFGVMLGTWIFAILFFMILIKILPVIELPESYKIKNCEKYVFLPRIEVPALAKKVMVIGTFLVGIGMMVWGFTTWMYDYAPVKWLTGIFLLCSVPLQICLIQPKTIASPWQFVAPEAGTRIVQWKEIQWK